MIPQYKRIPWQFEIGQRLLNNNDSYYTVIDILAGDYIVFEAECQHYRYVKAWMPRMFLRTGNDGKVEVLTWGQGHYLREYEGEKSDV